MFVLFDKFNLDPQINNEHAETGVDITYLKRNIDHKINRSRK